MVDLEKLRKKINLIEDNLTKLEILKQFSREELMGDFIRLAAVKYFLQTSIEAMIDIANHIIARERYAAPTSSADAFKILFEHKVISEAGNRQYSLMAKFRNRVVHIYNEVDPEEIYNILQHHLIDFRSFIAEVATLLN